MKTLFLTLLLLIVHAPAYATQLCGFKSSTCTSGPETRLIDGEPVYRDCWEYTNEFSCTTQETFTTCEPYIQKGCQLNNSWCAEQVDIGNKAECLTEGREYKCKVADEQTTTVSDCGNQQFCIEGNCFDTGTVPDPDFAKAVAGMEVAREAGVYVDETTFEVFKGQVNKCGKTVLQNCCKTPESETNGLTNAAIIVGGSAYAFDVLGVGSAKSSIFVGGFDPYTFSLGIAILVIQEMLKCEQDEVMVAVKRDHGLCHYVGEYCSEKVNLGLTKVCVKHKETYCCFNSKLGRMINEAARVQMPHLKWGTPTAPSCNGITIEQFQSMDLSKVDFTEFYGDIQAKSPDLLGTTNNAQDKVQCYFQQGC